MTFILLSVLSFALSNCLWVYPLRRLSFLEVIIVRSFITSALFWITIFMTSLGSFPQPSASPHSLFGRNVIYAVLLCIFSFFGLYFYVKSLRFEKVSVAAPVSSISSLVGVGTAILFLGEQLSIPFIIALLFAFVGVALVNDKPIKPFRISIGVGYNLLAAVFWGMSFALFSVSVKELGPLLFSAILESTVCVCSILLFRVENKKWLLPIHQIDKSIIVLALLGFAGVIFYNLSFRYLPVSTVSLISIITPALSLVFGAIVLRERLKQQQYFGIVLILIGLLTLQL